MANKIVREIIHAKGIDIGIYTKDFENEYISLTDIAKYRNDNDPRFVIQNWMRNRNTVEFLAVWEELHNPDFNRVQFEAVRSEAGLNRFVMTPTKWIEQTNAIGIVSKAGRYPPLRKVGHAGAVPFDCTQWVHPAVLSKVPACRRYALSCKSPLCRCSVQAISS